MNGATGTGVDGPFFERLERRPRLSDEFAELRLESILARQLPVGDRYGRSES